MSEPRQMRHAPELPGGDSSQWSQWPTQDEAAAELGITRRSIQRYGERGEIEIRYRPVEGRKPEAVCNPRDIERLKPKAHVMPAEAVLQNAVPETALAPMLSAKGFEGMAAAVRELASALAYQADAAREEREEPRVALTEKLWLSLDEAVQYSGLGRSFVRELARTDQVKALKAGRGGAWRILRASLEGYGK